MQHGSVSGRLRGERVADVGRVRSELRQQHRELAQPLSLHLDCGERRRSGVPRPRRGSAVPQHSVPRRLRDERLAGMGPVLGHMRLWYAGTGPARNFTGIERRGRMRADERARLVLGCRHVPGRLHNHELGRMVHLRPRVCIWELAARAIRGRGGCCGWSGVPGARQYQPVRFATLR